MTTTVETSTHRERTTMYIVIAVVVLALIVVGLITFSAAKSNKEAEQKADQLSTALQAAGARTPSRDQIVRVLGDDGGAICANPAEALTKAALFSMLANGAAGPGTRPIIADSRLLKGELLVLHIYCPDKLPRFQELVDNLKSADVAKA